MELSIDGARIYAATGGKPFDPNKPAVILIHGAGMDHTVWALIARALASRGMAPLAIDLPGHGRSDGAPLTSVSDMARWVERIMTGAGLARAALVGHSMGAAIALEAAALLGERATSLALLGTSAAMPVHPALLTAAREKPADAYAMMTGWALAPSARMGANPAPGLSMSGATRALLDRNRDGVLAVDLAACGAWTSGAESARRVTCSTVLVLGALDAMTPAAKARALAEAIRGARTVTIPGSGHMMMQEAPDATLDALLAHLAPA